MASERVDMGGYTLTENASLARLNTLRVDARANLLADIRDAGKLPELLDFPAIRQGRLLVLGEGSNVLFTDDFHGTVLRMSTRGVQVESGGDSARIAVAAGERWDDFVRWTLGQGYAGLENLILIPGTVGAAPIQNIGAYGCEVAEFIESVEAWDLREHRVVTLGHATCAFAYRDSLFKHEPGRYIVTAVRFVLPRSRPLRTDYAGIDEELARMGVDKPAPFHVAEAVVRLRTRKLPDPAVIGNAGSFFKNPIVDASVADDRGGRLQGATRRRRRHLQPPRAGAGQPRPRQWPAVVGAGATGDGRRAREVRRAAGAGTGGDRRGLSPRHPGFTRRLVSFCPGASAQPRGPRVVHCACTSTPLAVPSRAQCERGAVAHAVLPERRPAGPKSKGGAPVSSILPVLRMGRCPVILTRGRRVAPTGF